MGAVCQPQLSDQELWPQNCDHDFECESWPSFLSVAHAHSTKRASHGHETVTMTLLLESWFRVHPHGFDPKVVATNLNMFRTIKFSSYMFCNGRNGNFGHHVFCSIVMVENLQPRL